MQKVICYIAMSLDGFIATPDGSVKWLDQFENSGEDYGYNNFISNIGSIICGANTYKQLPSLGPWPYEDMPFFVVTHENLKPEKPSVVISNEGLNKVLDTAKIAAGNKNIWLVGGGSLVGQFLDQGLLNELQIAIMPVVLGDGIKLFQNKKPAKLALKKATTFPGGVVMAEYMIEGRIN